MRFMAKNIHQNRSAGIQREILETLLILVSVMTVLISIISIAVSIESIYEVFVQL